VPDDLRVTFAVGVTSRHDEAMSTNEVVVRRIEPADHDVWQRLFHAYREFYEYDREQDVVDRVWEWIQDDTVEVNALVAELGGEVVGFAHHREFARPSSGKRGLYLDDLFTDPDVRGTGVGRALITRLGELAQERGMNKVRWITAADNTTAQRLYDDLAQRTTWVTYDFRV
jgi:GNAT superfamily N-acetyltransferase